MAGIGNSQLTVRLTTADIHNQRLTRTATGIGSTNGGFLWDPTTRSILKKEETDKQNDDNLIFLFEYRALLNSRVQTLITQLSNALASDLDIAMNATNPKWGDDRPAMNGLSTNVAQDPGAGRTAYNYMMGWFGAKNEIATGALTPAGSPTAPFEIDFVGTQTVKAKGNSTIVTVEGGKEVDILVASNLQLGRPTFNYSNQSADVTFPGENRLNDSFSGPLGATAINAGAKNLFEKVLFDAVSSVEMRPVLSSGLFKNLVVAASSSLPTGSQIQASFNLNYQGTQQGGNLTISADKITAFYHS